MHGVAEEFFVAQHCGVRQPVNLEFQLDALDSKILTFEFHLKIKLKS
jgi:hypothetical protein